MSNKADKPPRWIERIIKELKGCVKAIDPVGGYGYRLLGPTKRFPNWVLVMFPQNNELYGGRYDGRCVPPGFSVCLTAAMQLFDAPPHVDWITPGTFSGELDGPHLLFDGVYRGHDLVVQIYDQAPANEPPSLRLNHLNGQVTPYEHRNAEHS